MPNMDGTGPFGMGQNGKGLGPCGRGQRTGWGAGRTAWRVGGRGWGFLPTQTPIQDEKVTLEQQKEWLESALAEISERLKGLEEKGA